MEAGAPRRPGAGRREAAEKPKQRLPFAREARKAGGWACQGDAGGSQVSTRAAGSHGRLQSRWPWSPGPSHLHGGQSRAMAQAPSQPTRGLARCLLGQPRPALTHPKIAAGNSCSEPDSAQRAPGCWGGAGAGVPGGLCLLLPWEPLSPPPAHGAPRGRVMQTSYSQSGPHRGADPVS